MSTQIFDQVNTFVSSIVLGMGCAVLYDIIRIFRRVITRNMIATIVEDIIFWVVVSILLFMLLYEKNGGMIRGFVICGMAIGMVIFESAIGKYMVKYISYALIKVLIFVKNWLKKISNLFKKVLKKLTKPITMSIGKKCEKFKEKRGVIIGRKSKAKKRQRQQVK